MEEIPHQEQVEELMFILLGRMYQNKTERALSEHYTELPDDLLCILNYAVKGLLYEQWVHGELLLYTGFKHGSICDIASPLMTQKGREWYQSQVIKNAPRWKKVLKYVGKRVLDKLIDAS